MASCGRKLIIRMCHPQCTRISSALWLLQSDKVGACMCVHTGVCAGDCNYNLYTLCICVTNRRGLEYCLCLCLYVHCIQGSHRLAWTILPCLYAEGIFTSAHACSVFIVAEARLCRGQNNLTSRCAEAWGKSILTKQVISVLS